MKYWVVLDNGILGTKGTLDVATINTGFTGSSCLSDIRCLSRAERSRRSARSREEYIEVRERVKSRCII